MKIFSYHRGMNKFNLIFDLDGTLVDSVEGIEHSIHVAVQQILGNQKIPDLRPLIGPPIGCILKKLFPDLHDLELSRIEEKFREVYDNEGWKLTHLYPGVFNVLKTLRSSGNSLFVATNKPMYPTLQILNELNLFPLLESWACRDSRQPPFSSKVEVLKNMINVQKLNLSTTFYIGDQLEDHQAAQACDILFIGVSYGYGNLIAEKPHEYPRINNFIDLIPILEKIRKSYE